MDRDVERKVLALLTERGLADAPAAQAEDPDVVRRWGVLIGGLVEQGALDEEVLVELIRDVTLQASTEAVDEAPSSESKTTMFWCSGDDGPPSSSASGTLPTRERSLDTLSGQPLRDRERYEIVSFLGQGGMGRVYKAWDPRLRRHVALKLLARDEPVVAQRFAREARSQARVEHPNVCRVYEVGEVEALLGG